METIEYRFIDKSSWPRGQWDDEPDKIQWADQATGLPCLAVRNDSGHWCGYVGVSDGHPFFARDYDGCDVRVHGGLTFADFCAPAEKDHGVCHVPGHGETDRVWWLGFDCAHMGDVVPGFLAIGFRRGEGAKYRTLKYVQNECKRLARRLDHIGKSK